MTIYKWLVKISSCNNFSSCRYWSKISTWCPCTVWSGLLQCAGSTFPLGLRAVWPLTDQGSNIASRQQTTDDSRTRDQNQEQIRAQTPGLDCCEKPRRLEWREHLSPSLVSLDDGSRGRTQNQTEEAGESSGSAGSADLSSRLVVPVTLHDTVWCGQSTSEPVPPPPLAPLLPSVRRNSSFMVPCRAAGVRRRWEGRTRREIK